MSEEVEKGMTKREFLEMTCIVLKEILNPNMLRSALEAAATKLDIPDAPSVVSNMLGPLEKKGGRKRKDGSGAEASAKKDKSRKMSVYNMFVVWFMEFAGSYGRHPAITELKAANPTANNMNLVSVFYKRMTAEQREAVKDRLLPYAGACSETGAVGAAVKRSEMDHPDTPLWKLVGLEPKPEYKTDPAQMRAEAAEARRLAHGTGAVTPGPTVTKALAEDDHVQEDEDARAAVTASKPDTDKKKDKKRKKEEGEAGPSEKKKKKSKDKGEDGGEKEHKQKKEKKEKKEKSEKKDKEKKTK
ncbi:hypothetical protein GPECTOR_18g71 [Gonium pectorale]|uniref:Uncharacterized protein n=1 Tax=Gonium pectorale TaxID=33097 RepID=A0A150GK59_GONPE|nr:hypothetical protein GPECTOR_18g71 [Gonium pectorale]|eukprot:KXZ50095.1 hypothetical protein GPECTOR_18g71 [Gonium pectorale]